MFEQFTDRARKAMQLASQEAQRFNHEYIGTEHILLGLVKEGSGVAAHVLKNLNVDLCKVRLEVEKLVQSGFDMVTMAERTQTPLAKKVIEYSMEEARNLGHNYVGTEHILLGLLREQEGVATQVLMNLGLKLEEVREEVLSLLGHGMEGGTFLSSHGEVLNGFVAMVKAAEGCVEAKKAQQQAEQRIQQLQAELVEVRRIYNEQLCTDQKLIFQQQQAIAALEFSAKVPEELRELFVAANRLLMTYRQADQEKIAELQQSVDRLRGHLDPLAETEEQLTRRVGHLESRLWGRPLKPGEPDPEPGQSLQP